MAPNRVIMGQKAGEGEKTVMTVTLSTEGLAADSYIVGLWRQDSADILGHTEVSVDAADPKFSTMFILDYWNKESTELKFCVYKVASGNSVSTDGFVGCAIVKCEALAQGGDSTVALEGSSASLKFSSKVAVKKEKKAPKPQPVKVNKAQEKLNKAALKEGGKKGQDLCGMSTFGVHHFMPAMDAPVGDWGLMQLCMDGMNKPVDPEGDDRKGGAGDIAKILFSAGEKDLIMYAHVPVELADKGASLKEWVDAVCSPADVGGEIIETTEFFCKAVAKGNPDAGKFPLKMRDAAIAAGFQFLRDRGLILDDDSDDEINFADECGIDLNGGGDGDY